LLSTPPDQAAGYVIGVIGANLLDDVVLSDPSVQQENGVTAAQVDSGGVLPPGPDNSGGFAAADLSTGQLRAIARSLGTGTQTSEGIAISFMLDVLHFQLVGGLSQATVGFDFVVDGTITTPPGTQLRVSGAELFFGSFRFATQDTSCCALGTDFPFPLDVHGTLDVTDGEDVTVFTELIAVVDSLLPVVGEVDLGHTGTFHLTLPPGVSFSSDSGVFLTRTATPVPESDTVTLFGSGLAVLTAWTLLARFRQSRSMASGTSVSTPRFCSPVHCAISVRRPDWL